MIPLRARLIVSRHRELLGRPLSSRRISAGPLLPLVYVVLLVVIAALLWINPSGSAAGNIVLLVLLAIVLGIAHLLVIDPRLVICERGLVLGRLIPMPFSPTYVIGGLEIDPRTVCVVSSGARAAAEVGLPSFHFQFFAYPGALGVPAVMFRGPWGSDVTTARSSQARRPNAKSLFSFSHRRAPQIAVEILQLIGRCGGIPHAFQPASGLYPIPVTGRREDAVRQIPGAWPPDSQRPDAERRSG